MAQQYALRLAETPLETASKINGFVQLAPYITSFFLFILNTRYCLSCLPFIKTSFSETGTGFVGTLINTEEVLPCDPSGGASASKAGTRAMSSRATLAANNLVFKALVPPQPTADTVLPTKPLNGSEMLILKAVKIEPVKPGESAWPALEKNHMVVYIVVDGVTYHYILTSTPTPGESELSQAVRVALSDTLVNSTKMTQYVGSDPVVSVADPNDNPRFKPCDTDKEKEFFQRNGVQTTLKELHTVNAERFQQLLSKDQDIISKLRREKGGIFLKHLEEKVEAGVYSVVESDDNKADEEKKAVSDPKEDSRKSVSCVDIHEPIADLTESNPNRTAENLIAQPSVNERGTDSNPDSDNGQKDGSKPRGAL